MRQRSTEMEEASLLSRATGKPVRTEDGAIVVSTPARLDGPVLPGSSSALRDAVARAHKGEVVRTLGVEIGPPREVVSVHWETQTRPRGEAVWWERERFPTRAGASLDLARLRLRRWAEDEVRLVKVTRYRRAR